jgi:hypothetical protein
VADIPFSLGSYTLDYPIDRYDYVSLSELELHSIAGKSNISDLELADWGFNACEDHAGFASSKQDPDTVTLDIVSDLFPSSSTRNYDFQQRRNSDNMHKPLYLHGRASQKPNAVIKDWYLAHSTSPYPGPNEVRELATSSGRTEQQVKICLSNLRARSKEGKYSPLIMGLVGI